VISDLQQTETPTLRREFIPRTVLAVFLVGRVTLTRVLLWVLQYPLSVSIQ